MDEQTTEVAVRIGRRIRALRAEKGWSQAMLARKIEFTAPGLWKIEAGRSDFRLSTLVKIAHTLDIPLERVVGGFASGPKMSDLFPALRGLEAVERQMLEIRELLGGGGQPREPEPPEGAGPKPPISLGM